MTPILATMVMIRYTAEKGDDFNAGWDGADRINCGSGEDTVFEFNEAEGDKATGNCENFS